jgi:hypothetical protein
MSDPIQDIEDAVVAACRKLGVRPNSNAMMQVAIDLAGSTMGDGILVLPDGGPLSPLDYADKLHSRMPEAFSGIDDKPDTKQVVTLTQKYQAEIAASRKRPSITDADLTRYTGITRQHMEERLAAAKN